MKAVVVMFDTLSRRFLSVYGNSWVKTPNFDRLATKCTVFDNFYAGSLPCMPARRELHTGRYNFLHRSWGPLEPFDFSVIEALKNNNIYTHLVTDHSHYWEDGGSTYHTRYNSWEGLRGQEGDRWVPVVDKAALNIPQQASTSKHGISLYHNYANRTRQQTEDTMSSVLTVKAGLDFIEHNKDTDNWFLQIECFDPHEPFVVPQRFLDLYKDDYKGPVFDWPPMSPVSKESESEKRHIINRYAALISMCDHYLGEVLDRFDELDLWKDTLLIVNTDHGFLMGEHDWWGKNMQPVYNEVAHLPFFLYDPRLSIHSANSSKLSRTIDIAPTLLDFFGIEKPTEVLGNKLSDLDENRVALFGNFGGHVNVTDGEWVYMRAPLKSTNSPLFEYTLMPTRIRGFIEKNMLKKASLVNEFSFTKGIPVLKVPASSFVNPYRFGNKLFSNSTDYEQKHLIDDPSLELNMLEKLRSAMIEAEAPIEQYERLGLHKEQSLTQEELIAQQQQRIADLHISLSFEVTPKQMAKLRYVRDLIPVQMQPLIIGMIEDAVKKIPNVDIAITEVLKNVLEQQKMPKQYLDMILSSMEFADKTE